MKTITRGIGASSAPSSPVDFGVAKDYFCLMVGRELRGEGSRADREYLERRENVAYWGTELALIKRNIESQMTSRKADLEKIHADCLAEGPLRKQEFFRAKTEFDQWRGRVLYVTTALEARFLLIKKLKKKYGEGREDTFIEQLRELVHAAKRLLPDSAVEWHQQYENLFRRKKKGEVV